MKLFYLLLGCTPNGRNIEQHDVFFGIAEKLQDLIPDIKSFWKEANGKIHIDCCQVVEFVDGYKVIIAQKDELNSHKDQLFFVNMGGYKRNVFKEFHEQHLMVAQSLNEIIARAKDTEFYKTMGFGNAPSHIDNKFGVDIDDVYNINDILPTKMKELYTIVLQKTSDDIITENKMLHGYMTLDKLDDFI